MEPLCETTSNPCVGRVVVVSPALPRTRCTAMRVHRRQRNALCARAGGCRQPAPPAALRTRHSGALRMPVLKPATRRLARTHGRARGARSAWPCRWRGPCGSCPFARTAASWRCCALGGGGAAASGARNRVRRARRGANQTTRMYSLCHELHVCSTALCASRICAETSRTNAQQDGAQGSPDAHGFLDRSIREEELPTNVSDSPCTPKSGALRIEVLRCCGQGRGAPSCAPRKLRLSLLRLGPPTGSTHGDAVEEWWFKGYIAAEDVSFQECTP